MLFFGYLKLARDSIRGARWRSLLTMLGIIIGVAAVVVTISLGEGIKKQVTDQIANRGDDLITVLPGERIKRDESGHIENANLFFGQNSAAFTEIDYKTLENVSGLSAVVPFGRVIGLARTPERTYSQAEVIAVTDKTPGILNQPIEFGSFFKDDEAGSRDAVIGRHVAEQLFGENVPLGKSFTIRDREFIVRGILEEFAETAYFLPVTDYNNAIFIPYRIGQEMVGGNIQIHQILIKPASPDTINDRVEAINAALTHARGGAHDFTVLKQHENLALADGVLSLLTNLIAAVAAISIVVGGIGVMNIMLVSVSERTKEIGIRKAVGATNRQILYQFMTEAVLISFIGGLLGLLVALLASILLRVFTPLQPIITLPVVAIACGITLIAGIVFGTMPALKAARKDPIDALRHE
jgi:putative ABC transport system permease protein